LNYSLQNHSGITRKYTLFGLLDFVKAKIGFIMNLPLYLNIILYFLFGGENSHKSSMRQASHFGFLATQI